MNDLNELLRQANNSTLLCHFKYIVVLACVRRDIYEKVSGTTWTDTALVIICHSVVLVIYVVVGIAVLCDILYIFL